MLGEDVRRVMELYPKIFFACHARHVRDPQTRTLVSAHQVQILDHLDADEPTSLSGLARHMGVTVGTMSVGVERLVRRGYVRRDRDPSDGRRVNLRLTPAGARVRESHSVLEPELVRSMLLGLEGERRARALDGLALLAEAAQGIMHAKHPYALRERRGSPVPEPPT